MQRAGSEFWLGNNDMTAHNTGDKERIARSQRAFNQKNKEHVSSYWRQYPLKQQVMGQRIMEKLLRQEQRTDQTKTSWQKFNRNMTEYRSLEDLRPRVREHASGNDSSSQRYKIWNTESQGLKL